MLSKGFGEVGDPKGGNTRTTGSQFLEQYKTAQALAQLAAQHSQTGPPGSAPSSWDNSAATLGQYGEKRVENNLKIEFNQNTNAFICKVLNKYDCNPFFFSFFFHPVIV